MISIIKLLIELYILSINSQVFRQGLQPEARGRTRRKRWGYRRHHPLQAVSDAVGAVYELPKKGGSLIPLRTTHRPLTEGNESKMTEEIPTGRRRHDKKSLV